MSLGKDAVLTKGGKMSAAGIVDDPTTQTRVIPESRRADGSIRKERKVKPGFTPAEDVGRFRPSRVLRAQEEEAAAAKGARVGGGGGGGGVGGGRAPGPEAYVSPSSSVEATRRALAKSSISEAASVTPPSRASPTTPSPAPPPTRSDGPWRRAEIRTTTANEKTYSSNGRIQPGSSWKQSPKATVPQSTSSTATNGPSWRRPLKADVNDKKEKDTLSIPDSWDAETADDISTTDPQVEKEQSKDRTTDTGRERGKEEQEKDSIGTITEKLDSLQMDKSKSSKLS